MTATPVSFSFHWKLALIALETRPRYFQSPSHSRISGWLILRARPHSAHRPVGEVPSVQAALGGD